MEVGCDRLGQNKRRKRGATAWEEPGQADGKEGEK